MTAQRFDLRTIAPQPWKNGTGLTREIAFGGASAADFDWRISVAEVDRDAPFSAFPGDDRCITLLRGAGMRLCADDGSIDHALTAPLAPFCFRGELPLKATLVDGACTDFNVMTRRGRWSSEVAIHRAAAEPFVAQAATDIALLMCCEGEWIVGDATLAPMQGLLWHTPPGPTVIRPGSDRAALLAVRLCRDRRP
jgi:hypothetical protein